MTTYTKTPRKATPRTLCFVPNTDEMSPTAGKLTLCVGNQCDTYIVTEYPNGHTGRGFMLSKIGGDCAGYSVVCGEQGDSCDCLANTYGRRCKHRDGIAKLIDCGRL